MIISPFKHVDDLYLSLISLPLVESSLVSGRSSCHRTSLVPVAKEVILALHNIFRIIASAPSSEEPTYAWHTIGSQSREWLREALVNESVSEEWER